MKAEKGAPVSHWRGGSWSTEFKGLAQGDTEQQVLNQAFFSLAVLRLTCSRWDLRSFLYPAGSLAAAFELLAVACGNLTPWPGIEFRCPAMRVKSLGHWTTREVLWTKLSNLKSSVFFKALWLFNILTLYGLYCIASDGPFSPYDTRVTIQITPGHLVKWQGLGLSCLASGYRSHCSPN